MPMILLTTAIAETTSLSEAFRTNLYIPFE